MAARYRRDRAGFLREVSLTGITAAARRAARGKRRSAEVAAFIRNLESEALGLEREILSRAYCPGPYDTFIISDPRRRQITVAPFRDRVVHHAICDAMEPYLERLFIPDSYACRRGKGTLRAVQRAQHFCRRISRGISRGISRRVSRGISQHSGCFAAGCRSATSPASTWQTST